MQGLFHLLSAIACLAMACLVSPACAQAATPFAAQAEALVNDVVRDDAFSGAVLVARDGKPLLRQGFGLASREWDLPNTARTRFRIGSMSKAFTAAAVLKLADEHKLRLDDPVGQYVRELPPSWQVVTLRQLLAHTSGIPRYTALDDFDDVLVRLHHTPRQIVDLVKNQPLEFTPGTRFKYDNTGYLLLGCVIEAASGLSYPDYLQQRLFAPLGLRDTAYDDGQRILPRMAQPYADSAGEVRKGPPVDMSNTGAAGAVTSTVDDLLAWQRMLVAGRVLGPDSTAAMFSDGGHGYGMGWYVTKRFGRTVYEHGGDLMGFHAMLAYYPDDKVSVIVLGNHGDGAVVGEIADALARLALGVAPRHRTVAVDSRLLPRLVGRYQLTPDMVLSVVQDKGRLFARATGQRQFEIHPEGPNRWFPKVIDAELRFDDADPDHARYLILRQGGEDMKAPRID